MSFENFVNPSYIRMVAIKEYRDAFKNWEYNPGNLTLVYKPVKNQRGYAYEIDLEKCNTSAQVLDNIIQVSGKTWMPVEDVGRLVRCLYYLLNPQATLCSYGEDKIIDDVAKIINQNLETLCF